MILSLPDNIDSVEVIMLPPRQRRSTMLQSLISLSDIELEMVTTAVGEWCRVNHCAVDSAEGRHALSQAVDLVQSTQAHDALMAELSVRLAPLGGSELQR
jgi:hypothetical protein